MHIVGLNNAQSNTFNAQSTLNPPPTQKAPLDERGFRTFANRKRALHADVTLALFGILAGDDIHGLQDGVGGGLGD